MSLKEIKRIFKILQQCTLYNFLDNQIFEFFFMINGQWSRLDFGAQRFLFLVLFLDLAMVWVLVSGHSVALGHG